VTPDATHPPPHARLSVVLPADRPETVRRMREALRAQSVRDAIELVVVRWPDARRDFPSFVHDGFATVRVLDMAPGTPLPNGRAAGARAATTPLVFFAETHAFPCPGWAEAVLEATRSGSWQLVSSSFENGNPYGAVSWAGFILDYGVFSADLPEGEIDSAPIHKAVFRRDDLLAFGERLPAVLSAGDELPLALRAQGRRAYFAPRARISHLNPRRLALWLRGRALIGYLIGANRAERWSGARRALYLVLAPLIGPVLVWRIVPAVRHAARNHALPRGLWPAIVLGAFARAAGEAVAYAFGPVPALRERADAYELSDSAAIDAGNA
jgi:hypothetical protein